MTRILRRELAKKMNDNLSPEVINVLRDDFERLIASLWRPIETAPRDGSLIMVFAPEIGDDPSGIFVASFDANENEWLARLSLSSVLPTHWMPLPSPPEEA